MFTCRRPFSLTEIPARAFQNYNQVVKVAIPESVTSIGERAFTNCWSLTSITMMPEASVTAIGGSAFARCISLASITIPESVTVTGEGAFALCRSLESITIPQSVTAIADFAFADCRSAICKGTVRNGHWGRCLFRLRVFVVLA